MGESLLLVVQSVLQLRCRYAPTPLPYCCGLAFQVEKRRPKMARGWRYAACVVMLVLTVGTGRGRVEASERKGDDERRAEYER